MSDEKPLQFTSPRKQWEGLKPLARQMRREPTLAEAALWERLRNRHVGDARFRRQHTVEGFIVDFVCLEHGLVVEVDGDIHEQADQRAYDRERQLLLEARGFRVLRFSNADVLHSLDGVVEVIGKAIGRA